MIILEAYDIPPRLLKAVSNLYENTRARVITPDGETDEYFQVTTGIDTSRISLKFHVDFQ